MSEMNALDRPVRVPAVGASWNTNVIPSDVLAAHNAQTEDPADKLYTDARVADFLLDMERERDGARAEVERLRAELDRVAAMPMEEWYEWAASETLGEQP